KAIPDVRVLMLQHAIKVDALDAKILVPLSEPETAYTEATRVTWAYPGPSSVQLPAVTCKETGKGAVTYVAVPLDGLQFKDVWARQLAANLIERVVGERYLETDA